jgi:hypothetical protein
MTNNTEKQENDKVSMIEEGKNIFEGQSQIRTFTRHVGAVNPPNNIILEQKKEEAAIEILTQQRE